MTVLHFQSDMTMLWPCRRGDFFIWFRWAMFEEQPDILDVWEMRDGDSVLTTNRLEDLPTWFELHPTEVVDRFIYRLKERFDKGQYPPEPIDGPNMWRLQSGDRFAWVGDARPGRQDENGVLAIVEMGEAALAVHESKECTLDAFYGALSSSQLRPESRKRCQAAVSAVKAMGQPDTWAPDWALG